MASCSKASTPSAMKRACQRQMVGLPLPVSRWIVIVPTRSALSSTIRDRHTCFCGLFPEPITASSRSRSPGQAEPRYLSSSGQTRIGASRLESFVSADPLIASRTIHKRVHGDVP